MDTIEEATMDWKLELLPIPVTDVDRAKAFYVQVGFVADHDHAVGDDVRFVQLTPVGSACSIALGRGISDAPVGSARAQLVVADARAAQADLAARGIETSDVQTFPWGTFVFFEDPDGNRWSVQEIATARDTRARASARARVARPSSSASGRAPRGS